MWFAVSLIFPDSCAMSFEPQTITKDGDIIEHYVCGTGADVVSVMVTDSFDDTYDPGEPALLQQFVVEVSLPNSAALKPGTGRKEVAEVIGQAMLQHFIDKAPSPSPAAPYKESLERCRLVSVTAARARENRPSPSTAASYTDRCRLVSAARDQQAPPSDVTSECQYTDPSESPCRALLVSVARRHINLQRQRSHSAAKPDKRYRPREELPGDPTPLPERTHVSHPRHDRDDRSESCREFLPGDRTPPSESQSRRLEQYVSARRDVFGDWPRVHYDSSGNDPVYHSKATYDNMEEKHGRIPYVMGARERERGRGKYKGNGNGNGKPRGRPPAWKRHLTAALQPRSDRSLTASADPPPLVLRPHRDADRPPRDADRPLFGARRPPRDADQPPRDAPRPPSDHHTPPRDAELPPRPSITSPTEGPCAKTSSWRRREREQKAEDDRMIRLAMARGPARARGPSAFVDPRHREQPPQKRQRDE